MKMSITFLAVVFLAFTSQGQQLHQNQAIPKLSQPVDKSPHRLKKLAALLLTFNTVSAYCCSGPGKPVFSPSRGMKIMFKEGDISRLTASNHACFFKRVSKDAIFLIDFPNLLTVPDLYPKRALFESEIDGLGGVPQKISQESLVRHTVQWAAEMNLQCVIFSRDGIGAWECGTCAVCAGKQVDALIQRDALWLRLRQNRDVYIVTDDRELARQALKYPDLPASCQIISGQRFADVLIPDGLLLSSTSKYDAVHFNSDEMSWEGLDGLQTHEFIRNYVNWALHDASKKVRKDIKELAKDACV